MMSNFERQSQFIFNGQIVAAIIAAKIAKELPDVSVSVVHDSVCIDTMRDDSAEMWQVIERITEEVWQSLGLVKNDRQAP